MNKQNFLTILKRVKSLTNRNIVYQLYGFFFGSFLPFYFFFVCHS